MGIQDLVSRLAALAPSLIVLEATGGYETAVTAAPAGKGLPIIVVNSRHVRHFAKALGQLAKTDAIDARTLARFAERVRPAPRGLPSEAVQLLDALLTRRRQLIEMVVAEKNRLEVARGPDRRDIHPTHPLARAAAGRCRRGAQHRDPNQPSVAGGRMICCGACREWAG